MKVAVVGAGFAGLAVTWYLLQNKVDVSVFDMGEGASLAATGLLHPYIGKKALPIFRAKEGMKATLALLEIASRRRKVFEKSGILRFAINEDQKIQFKGDAFWISEGVTVYPRLYLEELKNLCRQAIFFRCRIESLDQIKGFDAVVLAAGQGTDHFVKLALKKTLGQSLLCRCRKKLPYAILAKGHIHPTQDPMYCQVGSTYEHTDLPDREKAFALIDQLGQYYPEVKNFEVVEIRSGVRIASLVGYMPIVDEVQPNLFVFGALGSRGLIYHALFAKELVTQLMQKLCF